MKLREHNLYDQIVENARLHPHQTALIFEEKSLSFQSYLQQVNQLARGLLAQGLKKGDRLAILLENCPEYLILYGACAQTGIISVFLNIRTSSEEIRKVLEKTAPQFLITQEKYQETATQLKDLCKSFQVDGTSNFSELLHQDFSTLESQVSLDEGFLIIPTAAVDGIPQNALLSQRNIQTSISMHLSEFGRASIQVYLGFLPLFHIAGTVSAWSTLYAGGCNLLMRNFDPEQAVEWIEKEKVTYFGSFPPMLERVLDVAKEKEKQLASLEVVYGLSAPSAIEQLHQQTQAEFWTVFGQTETSALLTIGKAKDSMGSAGKVNLYSTMAIVDERDQLVAQGESGEIVCRGDNVFLGYWGLDSINEYTFRNDWHHTGDLGKLDEHGYLWYVGRKPEKELIKTGGENVYPKEVEEVLNQHEKIQNCAVIGVQDETWGESIKAVCQLTDGANLEVEEVIHFVASQIASFKKPRFVDFVQEFPIKNGEIDRNKVKELYG